MVCHQPVFNLEVAIFEVLGKVNKAHWLAWTTLGSYIDLAET